LSLSRFQPLRPTPELPESLTVSRIVPTQPSYRIENRVF